MKKLILTTMLCTSLLAPMAAGAAKASAPQISDQAKATLHLNTIRDYLELESSDTDEVYITLLHDISLFISIYSESDVVADALFLKGEVLYRRDMPEFALMSWLQVIYQYPKSNAAVLARQKALGLVEDSFEEYRQNIGEIVDAKPTEDASTNLATLITKLYAIKNEDIVIALTDLERYFLNSYPSHKLIDEVLVLYAHCISMESAESGIFVFEKLIKLYPNSLYRPEAMLAVADLEGSRMGNYQSAADKYRTLIKEYPNHDMVKFAYSNLANILQNELESHEEAASILKTIIKLYPQDKLALKALRTLADMQQKDLEVPIEAVKTLQQLAHTFPNNEEAKPALIDAIDIAEEAEGDPELYISVQEQFVKSFPNAEEAPPILFNIGEFIDQTLHDRIRAKEVFRRFINLYPWHDLAADARLLI